MTFKRLVGLVVGAALVVGCSSTDSADPDSADPSSEVGTSAEALSGGWHWTISNAGLFYGSYTNACHSSQFRTIPAERHVYISGTYNCGGNCWAWTQEESTGYFGVALCSHIR